MSCDEAGDFSAGVDGEIVLADLPQQSAAQAQHGEGDREETTLGGPRAFKASNTCKPCAIDTITPA